MKTFGNNGYSACPAGHAPYPNRWQTFKKQLMISNTSRPKELLNIGYPIFIGFIFITLSSFYPIKLKYDSFTGINSFIYISGFGLCLKDFDTSNFTEYDKEKMNKLNVSISETGNITRGVSYFSHEKNNPFSSETVLSKIINESDLFDLKHAFNKENRFVVDKYGNYGYKIDPSLVKRIIQLIRADLDTNSDEIENDIIYEIAKEKVLLDYLNQSISIDSANDFTNNAFQEYNGKIYGSKLFTYSHVGGHKIEKMRDYVAWFKGLQRESVDDWIYIRNKKNFEYLGTNYVIKASNSYQTRITDLERILFLCDLSLKYNIILYVV